MIYYREKRRRKKLMTQSTPRIGMSIRDGTQTDQFKCNKGNEREKKRNTQPKYEIRFSCLRSSSFFISIQCIICEFRLKKSTQGKSHYAAQSKCEMRKKNTKQQLWKTLAVERKNEQHTKFLRKDRITPVFRINITSQLDYNKNIRETTEKKEKTPTISQSFLFHFCLDVAYFSFD